MVQCLHIEWGDSTGYATPVRCGGPVSPAGDGGAANDKSGGADSKKAKASKKDKEQKTEEENNNSKFGTGSGTGTGSSGASMESVSEAMRGERSGMLGVNLDGKRKAIFDSVK